MHRLRRRGHTGAQKSVGAGPPGSVLVSFQAIWFLMEVPWGFPGGSVSKEASGECRKSRFDTWVRKIRWRRKWQPSPAFLPGDPMDRGAWQTTVSIITTLCLSKKRREGLPTSEPPGPCKVETLERRACEAETPPQEAQPPRSNLKSS